VKSVFAACTLSCGMGVWAAAKRGTQTAPSQIQTSRRRIEDEIMSAGLAKYEPASATLGVRV
jgi:hypothetical protein